MGKIEIMEYLRSIDWSEQLTAKILEVVANYVVFLRDPDDYYGYDRRYYITKEDAMADYESRVVSVIPYDFCYCIVSSLHDDSFSMQRIIPSPEESLFLGETDE